MREVQAYKSRDGKLFTTENEALAYESALLWHEEIMKFKASGFAPYSTSAQVSMMDKSIIAWENYKATIIQEQESKEK